MECQGKKANSARKNRLKRKEREFYLSDFNKRWKPTEGMNVFLSKRKDPDFRLGLCGSLLFVSEPQEGRILICISSSNIPVFSCCSRQPDRFTG